MQKSTFELSLPGERYCVLVCTIVQSQHFLPLAGQQTWIRTSTYCVWGVGGGCLGTQGRFKEDLWLGRVEVNWAQRGRAGECRWGEEEETGFKFTEQQIYLLPVLEAFLAYGSLSSFVFFWLSLREPVSKSQAQCGGAPM